MGFIFNGKKNVVSEGNLSEMLFWDRFTQKITDYLLTRSEMSAKGLKAAVLPPLSKIQVTKYPVTESKKWSVTGPGKKSIYLCMLNKGF